VKFKIEGFLRHLAIFSAMMASGGNKIIPAEVWLVLCVMCCITLLHWNIPIHKRLTKIYIWIGLVDLLLIYQGGISAIPSVLSRTAVFITSILLIEVYMKRSMDLLMSDIFNIGRFMSIQAILTFILGAAASGLFTSIIIDDITYKTIGFFFNYHIIENVSTQYIRPNGFFYEPGVFQIYLSIFLYVYLYWRLSIAWAFVACVAQIAVWSTTGLLITIVLLLLSFNRIRTNVPKVWRLVFVMILCLALTPLAFVVTNNVAEKTSGDLRGSSFARLYDLNTGLSIVQSKPLEGIGFNTERYLEFSSQLGEVGNDLNPLLLIERPNTNGVIQTLYAIGIPLGGYLLIGLFRQKLFSNKIAMAVILSMSLYAEPLVFTPFFLLILLSWMLNDRRPTLRPNHV